MIGLAIFDMDGVIVDIKHVHYITLNEALQEIDNKYLISYNDHLNKFDGKKTYDKLKILSHERGLPIELHEKIWNNKQQKTLHCLESLKPNPSIVEAFVYLKSQGITIVVASNSIRETIKTVLLNTGYMKYVDFFLSNQDVVLAKPSPEIFLKAMIMDNVGPNDTIIFEDSPTGLQAAKASGAKVITVRSASDINIDLIKRSITPKFNSLKWQNNQLNVVIPMAGNGSRFKEAGYSFPKPLIEVNGKPMIQAVVDNLNVQANYTFIVQKEHYEKYTLKYLLEMISPSCNIITVDSVTQGAACTVLLAKNIINNDQSLLIANSDQFVEWNSDDFYYNCENKNDDGCILTFESIHPKWSFAKIDKNGFVTEVAEKKPISNNATVGIYYWKHGSDFVKYAEQMIQKNIRVNNEFYVCPVFNEAINDNKKIGVFNIDNMWGLGTPEDLKCFLEHYKLNNNNV
jgi:HAD superfamily hydrolase (TIGR01509 family)